MRHPPKREARSAWLFSARSSMEDRPIGSFSYMCLFDSVEFLVCIKHGDDVVNRGVLLDRVDGVENVAAVFGEYL